MKLPEHLVEAHNVNLPDSNTVLSRAFVNGAGAEKGWVEGHRGSEPATQELPADGERQDEVSIPRSSKSRRTEEPVVEATDPEEG